MKRSLAERVATVVLWLYPATFRRRFGREMLQSVRAEVHRAGSPRVLASLLRDAASSVPREWIGARSGRNREPMRNLVRDITAAVRLLRKQPSFTIAAVVTLALGIGANTAIFSLADATLLRPLKAQSPHELVTWPWSSSYPDFIDYTSRNDVFQGVAATGGGGRLNFTDGHRADLVPALFVSGNAFDLLGVRAAHGRLIAPPDDVRNGPLVAVLGYDFWRTRFGGDPGVVGRTFRTNGRPTLVIGVVEEGFRGTSLSVDPGLYIPVTVSSQVRTGFFARADALRTRGLVWLTVIGRLRTDVSIEEASAAMTTLYAQLHPREPGEEPAVATLRPLTGHALGGSADDIRRFVAILAGVVALTLLIGCANLANLLLAKGAARRREIGVRLALGGSRWRVTQLLLVESIVLSILGGAAGLAVARATFGLLSGYRLPGNVPIADLRLDLDTRALIITFGLSLVTGILFGAIPAWRAARLDVLHSLRDDTRSASPRSGVRNVLLGAQLAMSLVLLTGTGLFARSLHEALNRPLGFDASDLTTVSVNLGLARYDEPRAAAFYASALESVKRLPQVESVAWAGMIPTRGSWVVETNIETQPGSAPVAAHVNMAHVGPAYFRTLGARIVAGREFGPDDRTAPPLAVVNEAMARKYFGGGDPLGKRITMDGVASTIVGVVENVVDTAIRDEPTPFMYLAFDQSLSGRQSIATDAAHLFVRVRRDAAASLRMVADQLRALDPDVPVYDAAPFSERVAALLMTQRMGLLLFGLFGVLALCLATVGVYGVASYVAALRTREIGLRIALGASHASVKRLILSQSAVPLLVGLTAGLGIALYSARLLSAFLVGIQPHDGVTLAAAVALLTVVGVIASYLPAARAARMGPADALRQDR